MKKQYSKKQIQEAINYWKNQLNSMNESYDGSDGEVFTDTIADLFMAIGHFITPDEKSRTEICLLDEDEHQKYFIDKSMTLLKKDQIVLGFSQNDNIMTVEDFQNFLKKAMIVDINASVYFGLGEDTALVSISYDENTRAIKILPR